MIVLSWNCRGLGQPWAIPNLCGLARSHKPDVIFLFETLSHARKIEDVRVKLGFESCLAIDVEGHSGGLAVLWRKSSECKVLNYSRNFINLLVEDREHGNWRLTGFYGYPEHQRRRDSWNLLRSLREMSSIPWCIIGDFNDLLSQEDKQGLHSHPNWLCRGFRDAVTDCNLTDVRLEGHPFTWVKSRGTHRMVEERLDRAMVDTDWLSLFPEVRLTNLLASHSDHSPILLQSVSTTDNVRKNQSFKFENNWFKEPDLEDNVRAGWCFDGALDIIDRVAQCSDQLQRWGRRKRMRFKRDITHCSREMEVYRGSRDPVGIERFQKAQEQHAKLLVQEEDFWRQRAKMHWLKDGDLNTKFFHLSASARHKFKRIEKLLNEQDIMVSNQVDLCGVAKRYFDKLFQAKGGAHDQVLHLIQQKITDEDNEILLQSITKEELHTALFQMHPDKSPGPDGFNPAFYQRFWEMCGDDVFEAAKCWLDRGYFPATLNDTNICLIPKCDNPVSMNDLRPISLCNVLYKIISKALANRLKQCLSKCISEEQSAFLEGRSIIDNVIVASEIIHAMKRRTRGRKGDLALKIDISKAYDKVDWGFLQGMMLQLGFDEKWVNWIMMCVSSVNYSILVNFDRVGTVYPGRGLRQGDPLSPYLFILVTEGLSTLIKYSMARGDIHGVKICRRAPVVSHLLFADDCFIFCRANAQEANQLLNILRVYQDASGQEINLAKSEVLISRNISQAGQADLASILGVRHALGTGKYLGMPSIIGRSKKATFSFIKDRVWRKINSWNGRALSRAGKEVMLKSVIQAIPSYIMSLYLIPSSIIDEIERMMNSFWWGGGGNRKGVRWMAWDRLACPKSQGGLGFRNLRAFNMAMLAKQGWNLLNKPDALASKLLKSRYFPNNSFLEAKLGHNPSYAWRSIWSSRSILIHGCRWKIGDGSRVRVMQDPWLRNNSSSWMLSPQNIDVHNMYVCDLMNEGSNSWNMNLISGIFPPYIVDSIMQVPVLDVVTHDTLIWKEDKSGVYTVKTGYRLCMEKIMNVAKHFVPGEWKRIWRIKSPPKVRNLIWRICRDCLPTRKKLQERGVDCPSSCPVCDNSVEQTIHLLFGCQFSKEVWDVAGLKDVIEKRMTITSAPDSVIMDICASEDSTVVSKMAMVIWSLWYNRNNIIWNNKRSTPSQVNMMANSLWDDWRLANCISENSSDSQSHNHIHRWVKPPQGWLKCNVDAGFHPHQGVSSLGACIRDERGVFVRAHTALREPMLQVIEGEAMALLGAIQWVLSSGFQNVIFETDSKILSDAIFRKKEDISEFGSIVTEINRSSVKFCKMVQTGKRYNSHRDHDGDRQNQKRRVSDKNDNKGNDELIVYRILCPVEVIGSVIGKNGKVINSIRQETRAKVKVVDPFPGAKDRVITIYCYVKQKEDIEIDDEFDDDRKPLCAAQDALFKVQVAILNSIDALGDSDDKNNKKRKDKDECQILVPSSQSANIIGKAGATIKKLRSKTRANVKVTAKDAADPSHSCAMDFDNFVSIAGESEAVKRALFAVSSIMYKFGPKEDISLDTNVPETQPSIIIPSEVPYFPPGGLYQPSDPIISSAHVPQFLGATNAQDLHGYADAGNTWPLYSSALPVISGVDASLSEELIIRMLCPSNRIGRAIGKGGSTIKSIRQASGARIDVDDSKANYNECLIIITATESPSDLKSMAVEAVLLILGKISEEDDTSVSIRLLVPSKVIGCIIGKSGSVINEIRKITGADIQIFRSDKPKGADVNVELVEVGGAIGCVRDALIQIILRLRDDALREKDIGHNPSTGGESFYSSGASLSFPSMLPSISSIAAPLVYDQRAEGATGLGMLSSSSLYGYGSLPTGEDGYGSISYASNLYGGHRLSPPSILDMLIPANAVGKVLGRGGANVANIRKISGATVEISDTRSGRGDRIAQISGTPEQKRAAENLIQAFIMST